MNLAPTGEYDSEDAWRFHTLETQVGEEGSAIKTYNADYQYDFSDRLAFNTGDDTCFLVAFQNYLGRVKEGGRFWSGSYAAHSDVGDCLSDGLTPIDRGELDFTNWCAELSSRDIVDNAFCDQEGITVGDTAFVREFEESDVAMPDFPDYQQLITQ
jgi:hypothetical protein